MKKTLLIMAVLVLSCVIMGEVSAAQAKRGIATDPHLLNWSRLGGDPFFAGGAPTKARFQKLMAHNADVQAALSVIVQQNGQPAWVVSAAQKAAKEGKIKSGKLKRGYLGWMAFGRYGKIKIRPTKWVGSGSPSTWYVIATRTVTKTTSTCRIVTTYRYRVEAPKKCMNVVVPTRLKNVVKKTYPVYVTKRIGSKTGPLMAGWPITGVFGKKAPITKPSATKKVLFGYFPAKTSFVVTEEADAFPGFEPVISKLTGKTPAKPLTLILVNKEKYCPPPPPPLPKEHAVYAQKLNYNTGDWIAGWIINLSVDGSQVQKPSSGVGWTFLDYVEEGKTFTVFEEELPSWQAMTPTSVTKVMGKKDEYITFCNRPVKPPPPPPPSDKLKIKADFEADCGRSDFFVVDFQATVINPDGDAITVTWNWNGGSATGLNPRNIQFLYAVTYVITATVEDASGNRDSTTLTIRLSGPGTPPAP